MPVIRAYMPFGNQRISRAIGQNSSVTIALRFRPPIEGDAHNMNTNWTLIFALWYVPRYLSLLLARHKINCQYQFLKTYLDISSFWLDILSVHLFTAKNTLYSVKQESSCKS